MIERGMTVTIPIGFQAIQQDFGFCGTEIAGAAIPGQSHYHIAAHAAQVSAVEKARIVGFA